MRRLLILVALLASGCPEPDDECLVVGEARVLEGWEPRFSGILSNPQAGDVYLANDRVQVVIQGPGRNLAMNPYGGAIIDADVVRADGSMRDSFAELGTFVNLAGTSSADSVEVVYDGRCDAPAQVRVVGDYVLSDYINLGTGIDIVAPGALDGVDLNELHPLRFTTTYTAVPGEDFVRVSLRTENVGDRAVPYNLVWLAEGGATRAFVPKEEGWNLRSFGAAEYMVFAGDDAVYGIVPITAERVPQRGYVSLVGGYALSHDAPVLDIFGYPDAAPVVPVGGAVTSELAFAVGTTHSDVVSTLRGVVGAPVCATVSGVVRSGPGLPGAWVVAVADEGGALGDDLARTRTADDGSFSLCVPPGPVALLAGKPGHAHPGGVAPEVHRHDVPAAGLDGVQIDLPPTARLTASITDASGAPLPCRLTVYGVDPAPWSYRLDGDAFDPLPPGVVAMADSLDGSFTLDLPPGDYDAVFTRGPEYSLHREAVQLADAAAITGRLHRVVDTAGHLSGDFHVHAQWSPDAQISNAARVTNMAAEGVEILVSTDHAFVTDYAPVIDELGLGAWMTTLPGQEITTFDYGHFNAFPLEPDPTQHNRGAVDWPGSSPDVIGTTLLGDPEATVFQVNHPRAVPAPGEGNYFNNVDLQFDQDGAFVGPNARDPLAVRLDADARMLTSSFVAVEVMTWLDVQGLHDWFNFLNAGVRFTATANSDTHTLRVESSGWPRNYVRTEQDDPAALRSEDLVLAIHEGRNSLSFGPFVRLTAAGAEAAKTGDTVRPGDDGRVVVTATVQAPTWVPFDEVVLLDGGTGDVLAGGAVVPEVVAVGDSERLEVAISVALTPGADTWVVAMATGSAGLFPGVPYNTSDRSTLTLEAIRAGAVDGPATAFAIANPIFIDADGDGVITPTHRVLPPDHADWRWEDRTNPY